jgi:hypothetical protein
MTTVWIYVDTSRDIGDCDHLKLFESEAAANEWIKDNDPEGVAFEYDVWDRHPAGRALVPKSCNRPG